MINNALLALLLLGMTPPPPPSPDTTHETDICRLALEVPRGGIIVGKLCHVTGTTVQCDGEEVITVADQPAFGERSRNAARGVVLTPVEYSVREERYSSEVRYLLVSASHEAKRDLYLSLAHPVPVEVVTRACPEGSLYLNKGEDIVVFASGDKAAKLGISLSSFGKTNRAGDWLVAVFSRVR
jgi:hypothetical protein